MAAVSWTMKRGKLRLIVAVAAFLITLMVLTPYSTIVDGIWDNTLLVAILVPMAYYALSYAAERKVWHSIRAMIFLQIPYVLPALHKTLTDAGIPFTVLRTGYGDVAPLDRRWDQVIELDYGGLRMHLTAVWGRTDLYLGPVGEANAEEVAKVKGLIESAMAGA